MKYILIVLILFKYTCAIEMDKNEFFITAYIQSLHLNNNDQTDQAYNEKHDAYGIEYIYNNRYSLTYNHFINSRENDVDLLGLGYLYDFNEYLGFHLSGGYQKGYCFRSNPFDSVECTPKRDNESLFVLPMIYFKYKYIKIDFFTNFEMFSLRYNIKAF